MTKNIFLTFLLSILLTSCITVSLQTATPSAPHFVTSTLPPTKEMTPHPTRTPRPAPSTGTAVLTKSVKCKDGAVLLEDVTIPDNSKVPAGKIFTKTWKFKNTGTCAWTGFTIHYVTGERMNAPESAPVPETAAGEIVDISIDLTAPANDGTYTTHFSLHNAAGESIGIGAEQTFYVKVIVNAAGTSAPTPLSSTFPGIVVVSSGNSNCSYSENAGYVQELASLINQARRNAKLPTLSLNSQLTQAAQSHSIDMACNNFLDHNGSDGSSIVGRIINAGYSANVFGEIIAIGMPQNAIDQWAADALHWASVLDLSVTEMGIGYAYNANSAFGGYFTVDMGR
jgi:uncharacterized protein YkwD